MPTVPENKRRCRIAAVFAALVAIAIAAAALRGLALLWNRGREIPVLMYHNVLDADSLSVWQVSADEFARQMDELKAAGFRTILPDDIWRAARGLSFLPRRPVVITFDDGYEGVLTFAEPVLARHGFRAICYLIVGRLAGEGADRGAFESGPLLSTNEVAAMAARGTVSFGSHSMSHRAVPQQLAIEIPESRHALRRLTGVRTKSYCYPHGLHGYPFMDDALRHGKYRTALRCDDEVFRLSRGADLFSIPRVSIYGGRHDFRIESFSPHGGGAEAVVSNGGAAMPVRCLLREGKTGRAFLSDGAAIRVGQGRKSAGTSARLVWRTLPPDFDASSAEVFVCEQNGLFTYAAARP